MQTKAVAFTFFCLTLLINYGHDSLKEQAYFSFTTKKKKNTTIIQYLRLKY